MGTILLGRGGSTVVIGWQRITAHLGSEIRDPEVRGARVEEDHERLRRSANRNASSDVRETIRINKRCSQIDGTFAWTGTQRLGIWRVLQAQRGEC